MSGLRRRLCCSCLWCGRVRVQASLPGSSWRRGLIATHERWLPGHAGGMCQTCGATASRPVLQRRRQRRRRKRSRTDACSSTRVEACSLAGWGTSRWRCWWMSCHASSQGELEDVLLILMPGLTVMPECIQQSVFSVAGAAGGGRQEPAAGAPRNTPEVRFGCWCGAAAGCASAGALGSAH